MHRASLQQDMDTVDIRLMRIRPELLPLLAEVLSGQEEWADHVREEQGRLRAEGLSEEDCERLSFVTRSGRRDIESSGSRNGEKR